MPERCDTSIGLDAGCLERACARHAVLRRTSQNLTFGRREQRDNESDTWLFALAVIRLRPPDVVNDRRRRFALFIKHLVTDRFASSACALLHRICAATLLL